MLVLQRLLLAVLVFVTIAASALAQSAAAPPSVLTSVVTDISAGAMPAVRVRVFEPVSGTLIVETTTDAEGRFAIELPAAEYRVEVHAPAFLPFDETVALRPKGEPLEVVLDLEPVEVEIDVNPVEELIADTTSDVGCRRSPASTAATGGPVIGCGEYTGCSSPTAPEHFLHQSADRRRARCR